MKFGVIVVMGQLGNVVICFLVERFSFKNVIVIVCDFVKFSVFGIEVWIGDYV